MNQMKLAAAVLLSLAATQASAAGNMVFGGASVAEDSTFGYLGAVHAMNGDLSKQGVLLRGLLSYGEYNYDTTAVVGGNVDGQATGAELGVGYQWVNPGSRFSLYAGIDHQDHDLSPNDASNKVDGGETGGAVQAEFETLGSPWYGGLIGKYSSTYETYWVRGRVGYAFGSMIVGPEVVLGGNEEYDEKRYGLFLNVPVSTSVSVSVSAGHYKAEGDSAIRDQSGGYVGLNISSQF